MPHEFVIGLAGHPSSGKDTLAQYLVDHYGFVHISTGDMIRQYITEHKLGEATRDLLKVVSRNLRDEHGPDYFVRMALENPGQRLAISGLRTLGEVAGIRSAHGRIIVCTAPVTLRYQWAMNRGRATDGITFEKFQEQEKIEAASNDPNAQNVNAVVATADYVINNDGTLDQFLAKIDDLMKQLGLTRIN